MLGVTLNAEGYLQRLQAELGRIDRGAMDRWSDALYACWHDGRGVFIFGNGGSGTTASHMAEDLGKSTLDPDELYGNGCRRLRVMSLTDNAGWIMAVANDLCYEEIFVQQLKNFGQPGDLAIAISGSGNSPNVLRAVQWANDHGLHTFGLTGYDGGRLKQIQQDGLHVALHDMGMVESIHLCLFHWVLNDLYARIHAAGRYAVDSPHVPGR